MKYLCLLVQRQCWNLNKDVLNIFSKILSSCKQVPTANLGTNSGALTLSADTDETAWKGSVARLRFLLLLSS